MEEIEIKVEDDDWLGSDFIGSCKLKLAEVLKNQDVWYNLSWKNGSAGRIHLKVNQGVRERVESNKRARKKAVKDSSSSSSSSESEGDFEASKEAERLQRKE